MPSVPLIDFLARVVFGSYMLPYGNFFALAEALSRLTPFLGGEGVEGWRMGRHGAGRWGGVTVVGHGMRQ